MGKAVTDSSIDMFSNYVQKKYGTASLFVNETAELVKNNSVTQDIQNSINDYVDRKLKGINQ